MVRNYFFVKLLAFSLALIYASASASASANEFDRKLLISAHNKWRAEAGVNTKINYSNELEKSSKTWAEHLKQFNLCRMKHSSGKGRYGENIFWASALTWSDGRKEIQTVSPTKVVDSWGKEKADYDYASNSCAPGKTCGHYTQIVWRDTKEVGCAVTVCEDTLQQVWVCQYQPAGNWVGRKPY